MANFKTLKKRIFCIEGDWENDLRKKSSIKGILDFLENVNKVEYIHRNCNTKAEFISRLNQFKKYKSYNILYLAFHGSSNELYLNENESISLDEIEELLKEKLTDKIIYFGSCETLRINEKRLKEFVKITNANCLVGFTKKVDFIEGTALDLLFFDKAQYYLNSKYLKNGYQKNLSELIKKNGQIIIS
jgi:hypothetical protein